MPVRTGLCFVCKQPKRRRSTVLLPGVAARSLFPEWDLTVPFPARVCGPCIQADASRAGSEMPEEAAPVAVEA